jgi:hypothetical protein
MTREERQKLMRSEARFDRKRGKDPILLSAKDGKLFRYFVMRKKFWEKLTNHAEYSMYRGMGPVFGLLKLKFAGRI